MLCYTFVSLIIIFIGWAPVFLSAGAADAGRYLSVNVDYEDTNNETDNISNMFPAERLAYYQSGQVVSKSSSDFLSHHPKIIFHEPPHHFIPISHHGGHYLLSVEDANRTVENSDTSQKAERLLQIEEETVPDEGMVGLLKLRRRRSKDNTTTEPVVSITEETRETTDETATETINETTNEPTVEGPSESSIVGAGATTIDLTLETTNGVSVSPVEITLDSRTKTRDDDGTDLGEVPAGTGAENNNNNKNCGDNGDCSDEGEGGLLPFPSADSESSTTAISTEKQILLEAVVVGAVLGSIVLILVFLLICPPSCTSQSGSDIEDEISAVQEYFIYVAQ